MVDLEYEAKEEGDGAGDTLPLGVGGDEGAALEGVVQGDREAKVVGAVADDPRILLVQPHAGFDADGRQNGFDDARRVLLDEVVALEAGKKGDRRAQEC